MSHTEKTERWSCEELSACVYDYLDHELEPEEMAAAQGHLEGCQGCRDRIEQERQFLSTVRAKARRNSAPERLEESIRRFLSSH